MLIFIKVHHMNIYEIQIADFADFAAKLCGQQYKQLMATHGNPLQPGLFEHQLQLHRSKSDGLGHEFAPAFICDDFDGELFHGAAKDHLQDDPASH